MYKCKNFTITNCVNNYFFLKLSQDYGCPSCQTSSYVHVRLIKYDSCSVSNQCRSKCNSSKIFPDQRLVWPKKSAFSGIWNRGDGRFQRPFSIRLLHYSVHWCFITTCGLSKNFRGPEIAGAKQHLSHAKCTVDGSK